jgi:MoaA/NifB/PqqE/SkfB family radical SAM enzyme
MNNSLEPINYAYLETTNHCNLECSFCNRKEVIGKLNHMSLEKWQQLLSNIKHHPIKEAKLMGMGEPFLHPKFGEVTKIFKEVFPEAFLIVATNCQYSISPISKMRKNFEDALKNIDLLYLSIDGYKENYERDRSPAKWDKLIKFLNDLKTISKQKCKIVINYVVNKDNIFDIPKIEQFLKEYDLAELRLNIAQSWDPNESLKNNEKTFGYTVEQIEYLKKNYYHLIKGKSNWDFDDCFWVERGIYTTVEGNVKMCCMNTAALPFGNIFEEKIDDIRLKEQYQLVKQGCKTKQITEHCKNCSYKELTPILKELNV